MILTAISITGAQHLFEPVGMFNIPEAVNGLPAHPCEKAGGKQLTTCCSVSLESKKTIITDNQVCI